MMTDRQDMGDFSGEPLHDAAQWHALLAREDGDQRRWQDFTAWLEASTAHCQAFAAVERLYGEIDPLAEEIAPRLSPVPAARPRRPLLWLGLYAMAGLVLSLIALNSRPPRVAPAQGEHLQTAHGESRKQMLADGSQVQLNGDSAVDIAYSAGERRVRLARGEVLVTVAADPGRPFLLQAGNHDIRDIGTRFAVQWHDRQLAVLVAEGRVAVAATGSRQPGVTLMAGDRLLQSDDSPPVVQHVDAARALSWADGYLVYDDAPLSQVVKDLNRYVNRPILLPDRETQARRFSGVLQIDGEDRMLDRLAQFLPLTIERAGDGPVTIRLASPGK